MEFEPALALWQLRAAQGQVDDRRKPKSARTIEQYSTQLRVLQRVVGNLLGPPDTVRPKLKAWNEQVLDDFVRKRTSAATLRSYISALRSFFGFLAREQLYPVNLGEELRSTAAPPTIPRPVKDVHMDALFGAIDTTTPEGVRDFAMIWLYYNCLRNSEVRHLTTTQIEYAEKDSTLHLKFKGKGDKFRVVVLREEAATALAMHLLLTFAPDDYKAWLADAQAAIAARGGERDPSTDATEALFQTADVLLSRKLAGENHLVFPYNGKPMTRRQANRQFATWREKAGLPASIGPHALRHTFATEMLENDVDLLTLKEILGHESLKQTEGYAKVLTSKKARAVQKLRVPTGARRVLWS